MTPDEALEIVDAGSRRGLGWQNRFDGMFIGEICSEVLAAEVRRLRAKLNDAAEHLRCYGEHDWDCRRIRQNAPCTCGFSGAIEEVAKAALKETPQ